MAPLKPLSIPRLELCRANLLPKLLTSVRRALSVPLIQVYAWSDSTIVISWLDGHPKRFKTFVGNRLSSILTELPSSTWHHVPTAQNPADCASRGLSPVELVNHSLWWEGPTWLHSNPLIMPNQPLLGLGAAPELKAVCAVSQQMSICWIKNLSNSYYRIIRITAWCLRYLSNLNFFFMKCSHSISLMNSINLPTIILSHQVAQSWPSRRSLTSMGCFVWVGDLQTLTCTVLKHILSSCMGEVHYVINSCLTNMHLWATVDQVFSSPL